MFILEFTLFLSTQSKKHSDPVSEDEKEEESNSDIDIGEVTLQILYEISHVLGTCIALTKPYFGSKSKQHNFIRILRLLCEGKTINGMKLTNAVPYSTYVDQAVKSMVFGNERIATNASVHVATREIGLLQIFGMSYMQCKI